MRALVMMDSFKGTLTSTEAGNIVKKALEDSGAADECTVLPFADGGEGSLDAISSCTDTERINIRVKDPLGRDVDAFYLMDSDGCAVIEMAQASGLSLLSEEERNPMTASTFGLGQMIADALERGADRFYVYIGGSATNDGGCGMLSALGCSFLDSEGKPVRPGSQGLCDITDIDLSGLDKRLEKSEFTVCCDVDNPLLGKNGATMVFSAQKGADGPMMGVMEENMEHFADVSASALGRDLRNLPGAGAAGGIGFAFASYLKAELADGTGMIIRMLDVEGKLKRADMLITGEGRFDSQSYMGKGCVKLLRLAREKKRKTALVCGSIREGTEIDRSLIDYSASCVDEADGLSFEEIRRNAAENLRNACLKIIDSMAKARV